MTWDEIDMYGLSYCGLGYERMYDMDLFILYKLLKAEMDREAHTYDTDMLKLSWQTAFLMNATGNYKRDVKPENLYVPYEERQKLQLDEESKQSSIQAKRDELLKTFNIKE